MWQGVGSFANVMKCGVVELMKRNTLMWFGYVERMTGEDFVKKCVSSQVIVREEGHLEDGRIE